ncbi:MAG: hypothetical protein JXB32_04085 [Deltaproteobacteria bacterium]|nr:hypothetical protein [Deltaproteobacteria bacterium]
MSRLSKLDVECAVPLAVRDELQPPEVDAILEIVFLAAAADGSLADEEADAFIRIMLRLFGQHATPDRIRGVMQQIAARVQRGESCQAARCARVGQLTPTLQRAVSRELAYKLSYVMLMSDLDTNEDEFAFDLELRRTLGISAERAEDLADEAAHAVLGEPSSKGRGAPTCAGEPPSQMAFPFDDSPRPARPPAPRPAPKKAAKKPVRKVAKKPSKKPVRKVAKKLVRKASKKPARKPSKKPVRKVAKRPVRKSSKKPARKPSKKPVRKVAKKPVRKASKKPVRKASKKPVRKPSKKPVRKRSRR